MNKDTNQSDAWQPCPPGLLVRAVRLPQRRRRHKAVNRALAAGLTLLLVAWGGIYMSSRDRQEREFNFGGIACTEVRRLMPDYMARTLPPETAKQIGEHLDQCPHCGMLMKRMQNAMPAAMSRVLTPANAADERRSEIVAFRVQRRLSIAGGVSAIPGRGDPTRFSGGLSIARRPSALAR